MAIAYLLRLRSRQSSAGQQFTSTGAGWITSDGTATLRFRDPATFKETRSIVVKEGTEAIVRLNELEYVRGEIYANVWHSERIVRIPPRDGPVSGCIDLTGGPAANQKVD